MIIDATISGVYSNETEMGFRISWSGNKEDSGFGQITMNRLKNGAIVIDSETMGKDFVKKVLTKLVDNAKACE